MPNSLPNPGRIKQVIEIPLTSGSCDRPNDDFFYWRDKVFEAVSMKLEALTDYVI